MKLANSASLVGQLVYETHTLSETPRTEICRRARSVRYIEVASCLECGASTHKNKPRCRSCEDAFWLSRPVEERPWSWVRGYVVRRDQHRCRSCNRHRQNFYPNCLVLRDLRRELGRNLTNEETALVLGIPIEELYLQLTVHHIFPRSEGGGNDFDNLITLCRECHDKVHNQAPKIRKKRRKRKHV